MACPFFLPTHRADNSGWLHPSRLPLGAGWSGQCCAPGHEGATPSDEELREHCNLGYARCTRLPEQRPADAIRFSIGRNRGAQLEIHYVCERSHRPTSHGKLEYDVAHGQWLSTHPDSQVQKLAECYLQSYLEKRIPMETH